MAPEPASGAGKRDALTYLLPVVVGNVVPLITLPLITRQVDVAAYGAWALCTVYGMFVTTVANFGLPLTVERDMFEQPTPEARGALLYSALLFVGSLLAVTIAATWWFGPALAGWLTENPANASLLLLTTCANAVMTIKAYYLMYLRSVSDARSYVRYSLDETIVSAATTLALLYTTSLGVLALPIGLLTAGAIVFVLATRHFLRLLPFGIALRPLVASLRTAYPLTLRILIGVVGKNADKYLLGQMASVASVGAYSIGQRVSYMVFAYMTALENVFVPGVYRRMFGHEPGGGEGIGRYLTPFAYASVAIALGIALFAHEVLFVLTPPEYHAAAPVIAVLSLYYAILFFGKQPQLMYAKRTMTGTVLSTVTISITIGLNYWFIRRLGFMGAAWATLAAGVISTALFMAAGQRAYRIGWEWGKLACIYLWLALGVAVSWAAWALPLSMPVALAAKLVMLTGYALIGVWFGILTRERVTDVIRDISARLGRPHRAATPGSPA